MAQTDLMLKAIFAGIVLGPSCIVALAGWKRVSAGKLIAAEFITFAIHIFFVFAIGFLTMGDCIEDLIGPVAGNYCHNIKNRIFEIGFGTDSAILVIVNWFLLRRRRV